MLNQGIQGCRGNGNLWVFPWVFPYGMGMGMILSLWVFPLVGSVGFLGACLISGTGRVKIPNSRDGIIKFQNVLSWKLGI